MDFEQIKTMFVDGIWRIVLVIVIIGATIIIQQIVRRLLQRYLEKSNKFMKVDKTKFSFLKHLVSALIFIIGISLAIYTIPSLRSLSVSILAGAGILAVVIGFASQAAFSNIVSGIFIAIFQPFRVGDTIKFSEKAGVVEDITLRHTVIRNFENRRFVVPNSKISEEIIENYNLTDEKTCRFVEFGISYDSDIDKAMKIMREEAMKHPDFLDNRSEEDKVKEEPPVVVRLLGFSDSSVNLRAWVWAESPGAAFRMGCDLNKSIKERFDREGIEIPFPYRTIVYKKDIDNTPKKKRMPKKG